MDKAIKTYVNTTEKIAAKDGLTLIVVDNANVAFANNTKDAEVYVFGKNTAITNAPTIISYLKNLSFNSKKLENTIVPVFTDF